VTYLPHHVPFHLITGIESRHSISFRQGKGHGWIVGPLAGLRMKGPPPIMSEMGVKLPGGMNSRESPCIADG
jgi:hypothetical protein